MITTILAAAATPAGGEENPYGLMAALEQGGSSPRPCSASWC